MFIVERSFLHTVGDCELELDIDIEVEVPDRATAPDDNDGPELSKVLKVSIEGYDITNPATLRAVEEAYHEWVNDNSTELEGADDGR